MTRPPLVPQPRLQEQSEFTFRVVSSRLWNTRGSLGLIQTFTCVFNTCSIHTVEGSSRDLHHQDGGLGCHFLTSCTGTSPVSAGEPPTCASPVRVSGTRLSAPQGCMCSGSIVGQQRRLTWKPQTLTPTLKKKPILTLGHFARHRKGPPETTGLFWKAPPRTRPELRAVKLFVTPLEVPAALPPAWAAPRDPLTPTGGWGAGAAPRTPGSRAPNAALTTGTRRPSSNALLPQRRSGCGRPARQELLRETLRKVWSLV